MSGAVKTINTIGSAMTPYLHQASNLLRYKETVNTLSTNDAQYDLAKESLQTSLANELNLLGQQYYQSYVQLSDEERQLQAQTQAYFGSRGVELFGSVMQDMSDIYNKLQKAKSNLYQNYINTYNAMRTKANYEATRYSLLQHQIHKSKRNALWDAVLSGADMLNKDLSYINLHKPKKVKVR